jgi:glutaconate CoA-transferase, subunit A
MGKLAARLELEQCIDRLVPAGAVLGLGGLHFHNMPMALVRETIRRDVAVSRLIPSIDGSIDADQLIGAGLVREVQIAYLGLEIYGLAPRFRAAAESGRVSVRDCEEAGFALGLAAGASGQPFAALPEGFFPPDGEIPTVRSVNPQDYRDVVDPFTGATHTLVRAIAPDVAFVHCQYIDARGNCGFLGATFLDVELAKASRVCVVQVEREVDELPPECRGYLPGYAVDAYCVVEGGAHPGSSHGLYSYDEPHLKRYAQAASTDEGFAAYRQDVIASSEEHYRAAASVPGRIAELTAGPVV